MLIQLLKKMSKSFKQQKKFEEQSSSDDIARKEQHITKNLDEMVELFNSIYSIPDNSDVSFRHITVDGLRKRAALLMISTITDIKDIERLVLLPLITNKDAEKKIIDIIPMQSVTTVSVVKDVVNEVNRGNVALFIEEEDKVYIIAASNVQSRSVDRSENEVTIRGPKESFNEKAITNISLVRKKIKNENLIVEEITMSKRSHNELYILYVRDLADDKMVSNIKSRISNLHVDAIQTLTLLEQYIEERPASIFPTMLYTERPDRAASFLEDGYIVLLMNNSPDCLVLPATFWSFIHSPEDHYQRFLYGNFTRLLRTLALFITIFASAIYVAITNYHAEMVPTDLLLAIASTRERVPFPAIVEILMMEIAFELIREAGLRVPSQIGPTIGIVGALILGQAAVQANIVSPIVVIVVALSGLSSFAIGDISMNFTIQILRFVFIISSSVLGIFGMTCLFTVGVFYLVSLKSFGVPYLSPMTPKYTSSGDTIFRKLVKNEVFRPGYIKQKDIKKKAEE